MLDTLAAARETVEDWCRERSWAPRAPLLVWMAYLAFRHLMDVDYSGVLGGLNLGIHEGGHLLFGWLSWDFLTAAGGTLLQLAAPMFSAWMFARQPDYFAVAFSGTWLATNMYHVATYVADARELDLPLVTAGGGEADHDWNFMLAALHLLDWDTRIATFVRLVAFVVAWSSVAAGARMLWLMTKKSEA